MAIRERRKIRTRKKEKYYYVSLPKQNQEIEGKLMMERLSRLSVPVEYSLSPSGCVCYRIKVSDVREGVGLKPVKVDEWNTIPFGLPGGMDYLPEEEAIWKLSKVNHLEFLFKEWKEIPRKKTIRVRKRRV